MHESRLGSLIIGFEISIDEIQSKYKMSKNRSQQDQQQIADQLEKRDSGDLAASCPTGLQD